MSDWPENDRRKDSDFGEANRFRIARLEEDVRDLERQIADYGALKEQVRHLSLSVEGMNRTVNAMTRALYTAALTVGGSAIIAATTVVFVFAR